MSSISPNEVQIRELVERIDDGPVVMINLLKFRESALDGDESGAVAYGRYARAVGGLIEDLGGHTVWAGRADQVLIGDSAQDWDLAVLIQYPTRRAFLEMTSHPEYQRIHSDRGSGLERTSLIACTPIEGAISWSDFAGAEST